jgi:hypothetical protein
MKNIIWHEVVVGILGADGTLIAGNVALNELFRSWIASGGVVSIVFGGLADDVLRDHVKVFPLTAKNIEAELKNLGFSLEVRDG